MSVVLVTGGTGAIGEAIVREFAKTEDVIFTYNGNEEKAESLKKELHCSAVKMNTADPDSVKAAVGYVLKEFGHTDVLVNNAGIAMIKPFLDTDYKDWRRIMDVDLDGCFNVTREVVPGMVSRKKGAVVNVSSVWGVQGASCEVAYSAAKAGVIGFTKALAKELGPSGITVNAVAPGVIDSPMNSSHLSEEELLELCEETPLGRLGKPSEVAQAVRFLAENRFVTGQILGIDGGFY